MARKINSQKQYMICLLLSMKRVRSDLLRFLMLKTECRTTYTTLAQRLTRIVGSAERAKYVAQFDTVRVLFVITFIHSRADKIEFSILIYDFIAIL